MDFLDFIKNSPTSFHAVSEIKKLLEENGFKELDEKKAFSVNLNSKYFIIRNGNSIIAFTTPSYLESYQFNITAAHQIHQHLSLSLILHLVWIDIII